MRHSTLCTAAICGLLFVEGAAYATDATYSYDSLGRIITVVYANGKTVTYTYDAAGNRTAHTIAASANNAPVANADAVSTPFNTPITFNPRANDADVDGDSLSITTKTNGNHSGTVAINSGATLTYSPNSMYSGPETFTYTVSDGHGGTATATVFATVGTDPNQPPSVTEDTETADFNTASTFDPRTNDSDPDGDTLTISAKTDGAHGTVAINSGTSVTYTPTTGYAGADTFTYTISDSHGGTAIGNVQMTVLEANTAPNAVNDSATAYAAYTSGPGVKPTKTLDPRTNDTDAEGDDLAVTAVTQGSHGTVGFTGTTVTYTWNTPETSAMTTSDSFTYTISDGRGGTDTATVNMTIIVDQ